MRPKTIPVCSVQLRQAKKLDTHTRSNLQFYSKPEYSSVVLFLNPQNIQYILSISKFQQIPLRSDAVPAVAPQTYLSLRKQRHAIFTV